MLLFALRCFFFFNDTATTEIYTLSLHDALPICLVVVVVDVGQVAQLALAELGRRHEEAQVARLGAEPLEATAQELARSEEHTSELQSRQYLVCRLLLEKKKHLKSLHSHISYVHY